MPNGQPSQLANLKPWRRGNSAPRRSNDVDRALRYARKMAPEALVFCAGLMQDASVDERTRLRAAEVIISVGMPRGDAAQALITNERVTSITIEIAHLEPHAEAPTTAPQLEHPVLTLDTVPVAVGNGDD